MKKALIIFSLLVSTQIFADDVDLIGLKDIKVEKSEIEQSLKNMRNSGQISEKDYQDSLEALKKMGNGDVDKLVEKAKAQMPK